jgi:MFS family permease
LLALTLVVIATAIATGGVGLRVLGSQAVGGRGYFYVLAAIAGYFALSSQAIKKHRVALCVALFFLPGLSAIFGRLLQAAPSGFSFLFAFFPPDADPNALGAELSIDLGMTRVNGLMAVAMAIFSWVLARHGIEKIFDFTRPWRMAILVAAIVVGALGGFRSAVLLMGLTFMVLFWLEKLWGTRIFLMLLFGMILGGALLIGFADKLPLTVQRALSILPVEIDPQIRASAEDSTRWRLDMWKAMLPQVPQYLLVGKGYTVSGDELYLSQESTYRGFGALWEGAATAGDYHNGPLTVLIPFGIWGLAAFSWLLVAGGRFLYTSLRDGAPELRQVNAFLLALFLARILFFVCVFGTLNGDLFHFTGILGLSVALNVSGQRANSPGKEMME